ncbi:MAG: hypothetical protein WAT79_05490 [Saprospiraceae bacterium]
MRFFNLILLIFSILNGVYAQDDVEVVETEDGNKILLVAKNNLIEEIEITLNLTYSGFQTKDQFPKKMNIKGGEEITIATLVRPSGVECEYSTSVSYKKLSMAGKRTTRTTGVQLNPTKINIFTRDDCARCAFVVKDFEKNKLVFLELNTTIAPSNKDLMFEKLQEVGFKETTVQMPVVIYKGEVYYNIKDLKTLAAKFK